MARNSFYGGSVAEEELQASSDINASVASAAASAAEASATAAANSLAGIGSAVTDTAADAVLTAADRVQTGLDATATAADRVQTGLDKTATNADAVSTAADAVSTADDLVATTAAKNSAEAALASLNSVYLGAQSSDPSTDNEGNALTTGDWFFNTTAGVTKIWTGSAWQPTAISTTGLLEKAGGTMTGDITFNSTQQFDGRDLSVDGAKLDLVEDNATADQTGAQIKTAYEAEADTNAYNDAAVTKLSGIEDNATADQTGAQIKTAYEGEADTNAYDDAAVTKLAGIEASADVTDATNVAAAGAIMASTVTIESESNGTPTGGNSGDVVYQY